MNLADKLDRLGGRKTARRRVEGGVPSSAPMPEVLAAALDARVSDEGVVIRERTFDLGERCGTAGLAALPEVLDSATGDWVYIDTETTGLSGGIGTLAFMVGVARYRDERTLAVRQYLLGGFGTEAAMLRDLFSWVGESAVLVSYNGKSFDLPLLSARSSLHGIVECLSSLPHLDLMYGVRRAYRKAWPDCRLQTAERRRLGMHRMGDLPGAAAPMAWQAWLRNGVSAPLGGVLRHNFQDVVSLALLHHALVDDYAGSSRPDADPGAVGRAWSVVGQAQRAIRVWELGLSRLDVAGRLELAAAYRRAGRWTDALRLWRELHAAGVKDAALALSKYYEHQARDYTAAMALLAACDPAERPLRSKRLRAKLGDNLALPLNDVCSGAVGKGDEVTGAIRDRQATT